MKETGCPILSNGSTGLTIRPYPESASSSGLVLLEGLAPSRAVLVATGRRISGETLHPEERAMVKRACPKRVSDLAAGRLCARAALALLGCPAVPIPAGTGREPLWPHGYTGSITHTDGLAAAVAARIGELESLGLDAQLVTAGRINEGMARLILAEEEQRLVRDWRMGMSESLSDGVTESLDGVHEGLSESVQDAAGGPDGTLEHGPDMVVDDGVTRGRSEGPPTAGDLLLHLVFCAKEALYKCLNPLVGRYFGFQYARLKEVGFEPEHRFAGSYTIELVEGLSGRFPAGFTLDGRFTLMGRILLVVSVLHAR